MALAFGFMVAAGTFGLSLAVIGFKRTVWP
jgi:hypothetical protein